MRLFTLVLIMVGFGLAGCSKDDSGGAAPAPQPKPRELGPCNQAIVDDYNKVYNACTGLETRSQAAACKAVAQDFVKEYPNVACLAEAKETKAQIEINTEIVQNIIDVITADGI